MLLANNLATTPGLLEESSSLEGFVEVGSELIIGKTSSLNSAFDQVCSWSGGRMNFVEQHAEPAANPIAHHCVTDFPADGVGSSQSVPFGLIVNEDNAQRPASTPSVGIGEPCKLPSGPNPIGHRSHRQIVTTLVPTSFQHCSTGARTHPGAKTVRLSPLSLVGLIGPLHRILFSRCHTRFAKPPWEVASDSVDNPTAPSRPAPNPWSTV